MVWIRLKKLFCVHWTQLGSVHPRHHRGCQQKPPPGNLQNPRELVSEPKLTVEQATTSNTRLDWPLLWIADHQDPVEKCRNAQWTSKRKREEHRVLRASNNASYAKVSGKHWSCTSANSAGFNRIKPHSILNGRSKKIEETALKALSWVWTLDSLAPPQAKIIKFITILSTPLVDDSNSNNAILRWSTSSGSICEQSADCTAKMWKNQVAIQVAIKWCFCERLHVDPCRTSQTSLDALRTPLTAPTCKWNSKKHALSDHAILLSPHRESAAGTATCSM